MLYRNSCHIVRCKNENAATVGNGKCLPKYTRSIIKRLIVSSVRQKNFIKKTTTGVKFFDSFIFFFIKSSESSSMQHIVYTRFRRILRFPNGYYPWIPIKLPNFCILISVSEIAHARNRCTFNENPRYYYQTLVLLTKKKNVHFQGIYKISKSKSFYKTGKYKLFECHVIMVRLT